MTTHVGQKITSNILSLLCIVQDEEEVPSEFGKESKDEDIKEESQKDEAATEKQDNSEKSADEEKSQEKTEEAGSKTEAKVRALICNVKTLDVNSLHK